jgi:3-oxoacyl-[acyl-carrier-protein] synthase-3
MKFENYIFSGFGYSAGKYKISNSDIQEAIDKGFLKGFSKERINQSSTYQDYIKQYPGASELDYFAGHVMGFVERHNVTPFPPTKKKLYHSETSLELGVKAVKNALQDSNIQAHNIDAWFVSTVSPHEQAPGIGATIKSFFTDFDNPSPAFTIASGCAGFNINLEKAIHYFKMHPEANNIVILHTETMSVFLTDRIKFVPFVTFGDAAAAVILSRSFDDEKCGILDIVNYHDLKMLDYVGVDNNWNLYMDDKLIKDRAIINIPYASEQCLKLSKWKTSDIDYFVPHQTGNIILKPSAEKLNIPFEKVFLEGQNYYGNISGATVPLSFSLLHEQNMLKDNHKILSATAGVGGNYGAFTYTHKKITTKKSEFFLFENNLKNKTVLVLGASGELGLEICKELDKREATLWLHGNTNINKLKAFQNAKVFKCDFSNKEDLNDFIEELKKSDTAFDYVIKTSGSVALDKAFDVNFYAPIQIINAITHKIKNTIINIGSATEDAELYENDIWISSNRAFHGYLSSASGEFFKYGIRTVYLQPGFLNRGIVDKINEKNVFRFMMYVAQPEKLKIEDVAKDIVSSLYLPKVLQIQYCYENAMLLGRMGYKLEVDV